MEGYRIEKRDAFAWRKSEVWWRVVSVPLNIGFCQAERGSGLCCELSCAPFSIIDSLSYIEMYVYCLPLTTTAPGLAEGEHTVGPHLLFFKWMHEFLAQGIFPEVIVPTSCVGRPQRHPCFIIRAFRDSIPNLVVWLRVCVPNKRGPWVICLLHLLFSLFGQTAWQLDRGTFLVWLDGPCEMFFLICL